MFLNQMDLIRRGKGGGASAALHVGRSIRLKKDAGAKLNGQEQAHLLNLSAKAQQAGY